MLRRLTRPQFRNAVRDVFGVEVNVADLDADIYNSGFATAGASAVVTSERGVEQYNSTIEDAVNAVFADPSRRAQFIGCTPSGQAGDPCVRGYIQTLGLRAWRRPLTSTELDRFVALASKAATDLGNAVEGARWATVALFTSPSFLYRAELGTTTNGSLRYTGYETAARLSFLIWSRALRSRHRRTDVDDVSGAVVACEWPARRDSRQGRILVAIREPERGVAHPAWQVHPRGADLSDHPAAPAGREHLAS
jgi:hypothetical protein